MKHFLLLKPKKKCPDAEDIKDDGKNLKKNSILRNEK